MLKNEDDNFQNLLKLKIAFSKLLKNEDLKNLLKIVKKMKTLLCAGSPNISQSTDGDRHAILTNILTNRHPTEYCTGMEKNHTYMSRNNGLHRLNCTSMIENNTHQREYNVHVCK